MMRGMGPGGPSAKEMEAYHASRKSKREPLVMPEDMDDQPPMAQIEEAKRRRDMGKSYDAATKKASGGMTKAYAKGGSVTRADGCVTKGHTKGRMV